jgi:hypothetical protein
MVVPPTNALRIQLFKYHNNEDPILQFENRSEITTIIGNMSSFRRNDDKIIVENAKAHIFYVYKIIVFKIDNFDKAIPVIQVCVGKFGV